MMMLFRLGLVLVVVLMDYFSLLWVMLFGWLVFDMLLVEVMWVGVLIIVVSGLYIVWCEYVWWWEEID